MRLTPKQHSITESVNQPIARPVNQRATSSFSIIHGHRPSTGNYIAPGKQGIQTNINNNTVVVERSSESGDIFTAESNRLLVSVFSSSQTDQSTRGRGKNTPRHTSASSSRTPSQSLCPNATASMRWAARSSAT